MAKADDVLFAITVEDVQHYAMCNRESLFTDLELEELRNGFMCVCFYDLIDAAEREAGLD